MPQNALFSTKQWSSGQQKKQRKDFFPTLHPLSSVIFATASATVVAFVLLRNSWLNLRCYTQREAMPTQKSARLFVRKITKGIHLCKPASLNRPIWAHVSNSSSTVHISWYVTFWKRGIYFKDTFLKHFNESLLPNGSLSNGWGLTAN